MKKSIIDRSPLKGKPRRNPGQSLDEEITELINSDFMSLALVASVSVAMAAYEWFRLLYPSPPQPIFMTILAAGILGYTVFRFFGIAKKVKTLKLGRDGEKVTGQYLEKLRTKGCMVYHDILGDNFNLDHVLISEKGIFIVETKTYSKSPTGKNVIGFREGKILINGNESLSNPIEQVSASIQFLSEVLLKETGVEYNVGAIIVYPGWFIENSIIQVNQKISVTNPKILFNLLNEKPVKNDSENIRKACSGLSRFIRRTELLNEQLKKA